MFFLLGIFLYLGFRFLLTGFFTMDQNERAVRTRFGRAVRWEGKSTLEDSIAATLNPEERERYNYPQVEVLGPGLHFKWPWEQIHRVSIATETMNMAFDPESPSANNGGALLEAVTHDQLNVGLNGQIRFRVCERNLYAYLFGVKNPMVHVTGYFVSNLREKISNFKASESSLTSSNASSNARLDERLGDLNSPDLSATEGVSINDLRKNLRDINELMVKECQSSAARYGIVLEASLITGIEPPKEVDSALAAINTAYNNVSSEISLARAAADQTITQSKRAVEIETLKAQAEVEPLVALQQELLNLKSQGLGALQAFVRNVRLPLLQRSKRIYLEKAWSASSEAHSGSDNISGRQ